MLSEPELPELVSINMKEFVIVGRDVAPLWAVGELAFVDFSKFSSLEFLFDQSIF